MRISDWSSDVCSSDLPGRRIREQAAYGGRFEAGGNRRARPPAGADEDRGERAAEGERQGLQGAPREAERRDQDAGGEDRRTDSPMAGREGQAGRRAEAEGAARPGGRTAAGGGGAEVVGWGRDRGGRRK